VGGYEDQVTAFLAAEAGTAATPQMRLHAVQLVALARSLTARDAGPGGGPQPGPGPGRAERLAPRRDPLYPASEPIKRICDTECG
jgi:hypothetical protein